MNAVKYLSRLTLVGFMLLVAVSLQSEEKTVDDSNGNKVSIAQEAKRPFLPPNLTSGLRVPAGETFHLGERQTGDFTVSARNDGQVAVTILATREKRREVVGEVKPGETVVRRFKSSDGVLVQNKSDKKASLYVEVWGSRDLAMYYKPNSEDPEADK